MVKALVNSLVRFTKYQLANQIVSILSVEYRQVSSIWLNKGWIYCKCCFPSAKSYKNSGIQKMFSSSSHPRSHRVFVEKRPFCSSKQVFSSLPGFPCAWLSRCWSTQGCTRMPWKKSFFMATNRHRVKDSPFQHPKDPDPKAARPAGFCCLSWNCKLRFSLRLWFAETMRTFISCACFHHGFFCWTHLSFSEVGIMPPFSLPWCARQAAAKKQSLVAAPVAAAPQWY